jgi:CRISPR-associated protein Csx17
MAELKLSGCTPEPLMSYLKALGVFRLVAEQADPATTLSWCGSVAHLHSKLDRDELIEFFVGRYRPTPIVAPWNGGSGFYGGGSNPLEAITASDVDRLQLYRNTIGRIRQFVPESKPKDDDKEALLIRCRSELPDDVIPWLDVCFVLGETRVTFFPLLGTGGNDGRLDFTNNFMQRLAEVVPFRSDAEPMSQSRSLLSAALFADTLVNLGRTAIGQFNPGGIGGANGTQGAFEANSRVNPWDFVLMIEGAMLFAGSAARRLGVGSSLRAVFPFSVESVAVGYGSATASEETTDGSRAELWLPLWDEPSTLAEVGHLFAEGRAQLGRRQARNSVEFALAVNLLGVNRGVKSFARYGFLKRNGLAFLATPLGRLTVELRPKARLLDDPPVTEWLDRWRRACSDKDKTPARYQSALRQIDRSMFAFANRSEHGNDESFLLNVLIALGNAERTLSRGLRFAADKYLRPLQGLSTQWLEQADDRSPEFRLASAVAGIREQRDGIGPFREFLEEVEVTNFVTWSPGSTSAVWSNRTLAANLAAVFRRRQMEAFRAGQSHVPLSSARPASLADVIAFLRSETDDEKLASLLWALPALSWSDVEFKLPEATSAVDVAVPLEFGVMRLLVDPLNLVADGEVWAIREAGDSTQPDPDVFAVLASGRPTAVQAALDRAACRLKSGAWPIIGHRNRQRAGKPFSGLLPSVAPERLLAAMLFPLANRDLEQIANLVLYPPENEE